MAGALLLAAWAGMFWFLFLSGRVNLYLSTRTSWVVPVGAILLTIASIGWLLSARVSAPEPVARREAVALTLMAVPVVLILALPPATLGSFSAAKKTPFASARFSSIYGQITSSSEIFSMIGLTLPSSTSFIES